LMLHTVDQLGLLCSDIENQMVNEEEFPVANPLRAAYRHSLLMGSFKKRLTELWIAWNLETTPGIFFAVTLIGAFVFCSVTFSLAVVAYLGTVGNLDGSLPCIATLVPPAIVFVLWNVYRARLARTKFWAPS